jgi:hypothetical protein
MKIRFVWALAAAVLLVVWSGCRCKTENDFDVIQENVEYGRREVYNLRTKTSMTVPLMMDVIEPCKKSKDPRPLVVFFHGANIECYNPYNQESYKHNNSSHISYIVDFARYHGCVVATVDYIPASLKLDNYAFAFNKGSLCPPGYLASLDSIEPKRNFYAMVSQGKEAIRYLKFKAGDYNIDPNNVTVIGFSNGGSIAQGIGWMDDNVPQPDYAALQPNVEYDSLSGVRDSIWNLFAGFLTGPGYQPVTVPYPYSIFRPDLGPLNGPHWNGFDAKVKNVVILCTAMSDTTILTSGGPRLFLFGSDQDTTIAGLLPATMDPCTNSPQLLIFSQIAARARAMGYVDGQNLEVMESTDPERHNYDSRELIDRIAAFIQ